MQVGDFSRDRFIHVGTLRAGLGNTVHRTGLSDFLRN